MLRQRAFKTRPVRLPRTCADAASARDSREEAPAVGLVVISGFVFKARTDARRQDDADVGQIDPRGGVGGDLKAAGGVGAVGRVREASAQCRARV